jgi:hypothetical protein
VNKLPVLVLLVLFACSAFSLVGLESVNASNLPVPQFTVRYIDESFDANTSPSTDPYTGETIPPTYFHVDHSYIQVSFQNNQLPAIPTDSHSEYYYNIRYKGQYTDHWIEARTASDGYYRASFFKTANFSLSVFSVTGEHVPNGTKINFQVQLMYGGIGKNLDEGPMGSLYFAGETSGWSNTQTVTVGESSITPTLSPTQTPMPTLDPTDSSIQQNLGTATPTESLMQPQTQQEAAFITDWQTAVIAALVVAVAALAVVVVLQRKSGSRKTGTP